MTVFNEVLVAEKEAAEAIETAKESMAAAVAQARIDHRANLEAEVNKLQQAEDTALFAYQAKIDAMVNKIQTEITTQVEATKNKFVNQKVELKAIIKKSL